MSFLAAFFYRQFIYTPPVPTASFKGKTAIVTGSNVGLGLEACRWMVQLGASRVILACRNVEKGEAAAKAIQATTSCSADTLEVWQLDMSTYASVLAFTERVKTELPRLDVVVANAGLASRTFRMTEDNEELITTNVVSTALLGCLILPKLRESALKFDTDTHFTVTSSELYEVAKFEERKAPAGQIFATLNDEAKANMLDRYNTSKLLGIFFTKELAAASPIETNRVIVNCVAPGFCHSDLHRELENPIKGIAMKILCRTTEVGSRTLVHGASAGPESHGQYVPDCRITPTRGLTEGEKGAELQSRVWEELKSKLEGIRRGVTSLA